MIRMIFLSAFLAIGLCGHTQQDEKHNSIYNALADTSSFAVPEISTLQLIKVIAEGSALLLDTRPYEEWASGHLPGAINVAPKPGMPMSLYTSDVQEVLRLVNGDKNRGLVLYCNGPFCDKSKRLSAELISEGFTNVVRYQLGIPFWQVTGNILIVEKEGLIYFRNDKTAVWVDARVDTEFKKETIQDAVNIPFHLLTGIKNTGVIKEAKDDGRLPMLDHNTRIIVFANNIKEAIAVAEAITKEAFHNVHCFNGSYQEARKTLERILLQDQDTGISTSFLTHPINVTELLNTKWISPVNDTCLESLCFTSEKTVMYFRCDKNMYTELGFRINGDKIEIEAYSKASMEPCSKIIFLMDNGVLKQPLNQDNNFPKNFIKVPGDMCN